MRKQLLKFLRLVNAKRQSTGYSKLPPICLRCNREIVKAFEKHGEEASKLPAKRANVRFPSDSILFA